MVFAFILDFAVGVVVTSFFFGNRRLVLQI
jgi:hypothetical protein